MSVWAPNVARRYADAVHTGHRESLRLTAVQAPVIPIVGRWIAETPGTISLGQGVVSYGPPPEAVEAARRFGGATERPPVRSGRGSARAGRPSRGEARARERDSGAAGESRAGHRGRQPGVHERGAGGDGSRRRDHPAGAVLLQSRDGDRDGWRASGRGSRRTTSYQLDVPAIAAAITPRTRAVVTVSPNNPTGAVYPAAALSAVNALCRARGVFHVHDEAYEYFTYGGARHFSPGSLDGRGDSHDLAVLAVEGVRDGELADRLHGDPGSRCRTRSTRSRTRCSICPPAVSQQAALAALVVGRAHAAAHVERARRHTAADLRQRCRPTTFRATCQRRRAPSTTSCARIRRLDSMTLTERLIREHRVAAIPGSAFADAAPSRSGSPTARSTPTSRDRAKVASAGSCAGHLDDAAQASAYFTLV